MKPKSKSQNRVDVSVNNPASDDKIPEILQKMNWHWPRDAEAEHQRVISSP